MKTFDPDFSLAKNRTSTEPYLIIAVELDAGTKYYSEKPVSDPLSVELDYIVSIGDVAKVVAEQQGQTRSIEIEISDVAKRLLDIVRGVQTYMRTVKVYQCFDGVDFADSDIIFVGKIKSSLRLETRETMTFTVVAIEAAIDVRIGNNTDAAQAKEQGEILPLVIGTVKRSKCAQIVESERTTLAVPLSEIGKVAVVSDSSEFPQDTVITLMIGYEMVRGKFTGCKFDIHQRGMVLATGGTIGSSTMGMSFKANLTPQGPSWIGYSVEFLTSNNQIYHRAIITNFISPNVYAKDTFTYISAGVRYRIRTLPSQHSVGTTVTEYKTEYKWVINDAVSQQVDFIEILGSPMLGDQKKIATSQMGTSPQYVRLRDADITVLLDDNAQTTVAMPFDPGLMRNMPYKSSDLLATLTGVNYSNPVDILIYLAQRFGFTYPDDFDVANVTAEKAKVNWLVAGLVIREKLTIDVLYDLAFQWRLSINFNNPIRFKYLENKTSAASLTLADAKRIFDSVEISTDEVIANKIEVIWGTEQEKFEVKDDASIAEYGEVSRSIKLWAIQEKNYALSIANFWLRRWAYPLERATVSTHLDTSELEINDWINITASGYYTAQPAEIVGINRKPGNDDIDKITYDLRLPRWAGCQTTCEQHEQTACATACEQYCTSGAETSCNYACETANQDACSLTCVTVCELACTSFVRLSDCGGSCEAACQQQCMTGCTTGCQEDCQSLCTAGCESGDQAGCATSCEYGCEVGCENTEQEQAGPCATTCQWGCQIGDEISDACETSCQGACEDACTSVCQAGCQTGEEACGLSCQVCCEFACVANCQLFCTAGTCQLACTSDYQQVSRTTCSSSCENGCQGACEGGCQECCMAEGTEGDWYCVTQCQTGCIQSCEIAIQADPANCATACQGWCMTSQQLGCDLYCTTGCVCACQIDCELLCTTGCETTCECTCQTTNQVCTYIVETCFSSCQGDCEITSMLGCATTCQGWCMTTNQLGCDLYCTVGCQCTCQDNCEINCTIGCEVTCELCACQTTEQTTCLSGVEPCYSSCQGTCETQDTASCFAVCQAFCQASNQAGCNLYCTAGCQCDCASTCQVNCRTLCETGCMCYAQTTAVSVDPIDNPCTFQCTSSVQPSLCKSYARISGIRADCNVSCINNCQTSCQGTCQLTLTTDCFSFCQAYCQSNIEAGCNYYCTVGCMCDCMSTCQANCRTMDCETSCQCTCRLAAQI